MAVISLTDYEPRPRFDGNPWVTARVEGTTDLETWDTVEDFDFDPVDEDPTDPQVRNFTFVLDDPAIIYLRVSFIDEDNNIDVTDPVPVAPGAVLASISDVMVRLGWSNLTEAQEAQANMLLGMATTTILDAIDKDLDWEIPLTVRPLMSMMSVELVCRAMSNPQAIGQISETIGARSYTMTFPREIPGSGIMLTELESRILRRAVYGTNAGTARSYQRDLYLYGQEAPLLNPVSIIE